MVPDKPQKVKKFHFTWCGHIGFRTRYYVKYSREETIRENTDTLAQPSYDFLFCAKGRGWAHFGSTYLLPTLKSDVFVLFLKKFILVQEIHTSTKGVICYNIIYVKK